MTRKELRRSGLLMMGTILILDGLRVIDIFTPHVMMILGFAVGIGFPDKESD